MDIRTGLRSLAPPFFLKLGPKVRRTFGKAAAVIAIFLACALPSAALEVSEVTVDFPLADLLEVAPEGGQAEVGAGGAEALPAKLGWEDDWFAYRQSILRGNLSDARDRIERIATYRQQRSIPNLYLPAAALLAEAGDASRQGQHEDALEIIEHALRLAPDDPAPHFLRAKVIWRQNKLRALSALDSLFQGYGSFFKDFRSYFPWALGLAQMMLISIVVASALTILLFAFRVYQRLGHDLHHFLRLPQWVWNVILPSLLILLLLTGMPLAVWLLLVALLMILHADGRERVAVGAALALMASLPLLVHLLSLSNAYYGGSVATALYEAERGGEGSSSVAALDTLRVKNPGNPRVLTAMAMVLKRSGQLREAESLLRQAADAAPDSPTILNNLGNIVLASGRIEQAIDLYRRALGYLDDARIHYNLSQALRDNLQLDEGEAQFVLAQRMDPDLAASLSSRQAQQEAAAGQRITVDVTSPRSMFLLQGLDPGEEGRRWRETLWAGMIPKVPFSLSWLVFAGSSAVFFAAWPLAAALPTARRCKKCNQLHCPRCSKATADPLCSQCRQIFLVRTGVDPASRVRKMMQIMRFSKNRILIARFLTILAPGAGHVYLGAGWQCLLYLLVTTLFWCRWIFWNGLYRNTAMLDIQSGVWARAAFGVLLVLFYLLAFRGVSDRLQER